MAATIEEAYERALACDPVSSFGCVLVLNRPVEGALGRRVAEHFVEVVLAPDYDADSLAALGAKPALRILRNRERRADTPGERDSGASSAGCSSRSATPRSRTAST